MDKAARAERQVDNDLYRTRYERKYGGRRW